LSNLSSEDKLEICMKILHELESQINAGYTEYKGTKTFIPKKVREIVQDGRTGFMVDDMNEMVRAVKKINSIVRKS